MYRWPNEDILKKMANRLYGAFGSAKGTVGKSDRRLNFLC